MRKVFATLLLVCFGMIVPLAGQPLRVCLLEMKERQEDCCKKCHTEHKDCCAEVGEIPDAPLPGTPLDVPPFIGFVLPVFEAACPVEIVPAQVTVGYLPPIRGPDSPGAFRSVLNIWRL